MPTGSIFFWNVGAPLSSQVRECSCLLKCSCPLPGPSLSRPRPSSPLAHSQRRTRAGTPAWACVDSPPISFLLSFSLSCVSFQIRVPAFLDLFMQSLFKPGARINQDHKHKYIHILAYAASVVETWKKVVSMPRAHGLSGDMNHLCLVLRVNFGCRESQAQLVSEMSFLVFLHKIAKVLNVLRKCASHL